MVFFHSLQCRDTPGTLYQRSRHSHQHQTDQTSLVIRFQLSEQMKNKLSHNYPTKFWKML